jgi:hypothetical protein
VLKPPAKRFGGQKRPSGKSFGWQIFKQDLHFRVKIQVSEAFQGLILAGGIRRAETFLRGQSDYEVAAFSPLACSSLYFCWVVA